MDYCDCVVLHNPNKYFELNSDRLILLVYLACLHSLKNSSGISDPKNMLVLITMTRQETEGEKLTWA